MRSRAGRATTIVGVLAVISAGASLSPFAPAAAPAVVTLAPTPVVGMAATCSLGYCASVGVLPKGFPRVVPLPAGARVLAGLAHGTSSWGVDLAVKGSPEAIMRAYLKRLAQAGFSSQGPNKPIGQRKGFGPTAVLGVTGSSKRLLVVAWLYRGAPDQIGPHEHLRPGEWGLSLSVGPAL